jgi:hypothetical protein
MHGQVADSDACCRYQILREFGTDSASRQQSDDDLNFTNISGASGRGPSHHVRRNVLHESFPEVELRQIRQYQQHQQQMSQQQHPGVRPSAPVNIVRRRASAGTCIPIPGAFMPFLSQYFTCSVCIVLLSLCFLCQHRTSGGRFWNRCSLFLSFVLTGTVSRPTAVLKPPCATIREALLKSSMLAGRQHAASTHGAADKRIYSSLPPSTVLGALSGADASGRGNLSSHQTIVKWMLDSQQNQGITGVSPESRVWVDLPAVMAKPGVVYVSQHGEGQNTVGSFEEVRAVEISSGSGHSMARVCGTWHLALCTLRTALYHFLAEC